MDNITLLSSGFPTALFPLKVSRGPECCSQEKLAEVRAFGAPPSPPRSSGRTTRLMASWPIRTTNS